MIRVRKHLLLTAVLVLAIGCSDDSPVNVPVTSPTTSTPSPSPEVIESSPEPALVRVPDVVGLRVANGQQQLEDASLFVSVVERYSNQPSGTILDQSERAGSKAEEGNTVKLTVAKSFPRVPNVVGRSLDYARRTLTDRGFEVRVTHETSSQRKDSIIRMSPSPGTEARPGRTVTIVVAKPAPAPPTGGGGGGSCTPGYSPCLPPASDYDCAGESGDGPKYTGVVTVTGSDPYGLDADNDGTGCE
jgi:resuscitation-promoting factor RpfB